MSARTIGRPSELSLRRFPRLRVLQMAVGFTALLIVQVLFGRPPGPQ